MEQSENSLHHINIRSNNRINLRNISGKDLRLESCEGAIDCHIPLLICSSNFLQEMIEDVIGLEEVPVIQLPQFAQIELEYLLSLLYTGEAMVNQDHMAAFYDLLQTLGIHLNLEMTPSHSYTTLSADRDPTAACRNLAGNRSILLPPSQELHSVETHSISLAPKGSSASALDTIKLSRRPVDFDNIKSSQEALLDGDGDKLKSLDEEGFMSSFPMKELRAVTEEGDVIEFTTDVSTSGSDDSFMDEATETDPLDAVQYHYEVEHLDQLEHPTAADHDTEGHLQPTFITLTTYTVGNAKTGSSCSTWPEEHDKDDDDLPVLTEQLEPNCSSDLCPTMPKAGNDDCERQDHHHQHHQEPEPPPGDELLECNVLLAGPDAMGSVSDASAVEDAENLLLFNEKDFKDEAVIAELMVLGPGGQEDAPPHEIIIKPETSHEHDNHPVPSFTHPQDVETEIAISSIMPSPERAEEPSSATILLAEDAPAPSPPPAAMPMPQQNDRYVCTICHRSFASLKRLTAHANLHLGKRFECHCGHKARSTGSLARHQEMKHVVRKFVCPTCNKTFASKQNLDAHNRIHTGEKPWHCELCKAGFNRLHHFRQHLSCNAHLRQMEAVQANGGAVPAHLDPDRNVPVTREIADVDTYKIETEAL